MKNSEIVTLLMFDYELLDCETILKYVKLLPKKVIRWLGAYHPDNLVRKKFFKFTNIEIGDDTVINQNLIVSDNYKPLLKIGKRVAISPNVTIICASAPNNSILIKNKYVLNKLIVNKPVVICDDVWIGANAVILPGVTIGKKSIIGANSLVNKDVPENVIFAGIPANLNRRLNNEE